MKTVPASVRRLIEEFSRLPGVGPKSAERLTFYLLRSGDPRRVDLGQAVLDLRSGVVICSTCCNLAESDPCVLCGDSGRDRSLICVVEQPLDIVALEKGGGYQGLYHVLGGALSPVDGIGPEELSIAPLIKRLDEGKISEVILATNHSLEGEATAMYLSRLITPKDITVTRIAQGLPMGADLEYADQVTLTRALEGRRSYS